MLCTLWFITSSLTGHACVDNVLTPILRLFPHSVSCARLCTSHCGPLPAVPRAITGPPQPYAWHRTNQEQSTVVVATHSRKLPRARADEGTGWPLVLKYCREHITLSCLSSSSSPSRRCGLRQTKLPLITKTIASTFSRTQSSGVWPSKMHLPSATCPQGLSDSDSLSPQVANSLPGMQPLNKKPSSFQVSPKQSSPFCH